MLNQLFIASLLALSATATTTVADAPRPASIKMPIDVCTKAGKIMFAVDGKIDTGIEGLSTSRFVLYATGAWTFVETMTSGSIVRQGEGCISLAQVKQIQKGLAAAPWKTKRYEVACMAFSPRYTEYSFFGKRVWTERMCGHEGLDSKSQAALDSATAIVNKLIASVK